MVSHLSLRGTCLLFPCYRGLSLSASPAAPDYVPEYSFGMDGSRLDNPLVVGDAGVQTNGPRTAFLMTRSNASTSSANLAAASARALMLAFVGIHSANVPGFILPFETLDRMAFEKNVRVIGQESLYRKAKPPSPVVAQSWMFPGSESPDLGFPSCVVD